MDLFKAHAYIATENPAAADHFILDLYHKIESFARSGLTGVDRSDIRAGVRSLSYRKRVVFFAISDRELIILRVLHGHQDISPDFFKTDKS